MLMQQAKQAYDAIAQKGRRDRLILEHLPMVRHLVGKMTAELPPGVDEDNLESAGVLGLVEAAHHFDPERRRAIQDLCLHAHPWGRPR